MPKKINNSPDDRTLYQVVSEDGSLAEDLEKSMLFKSYATLFEQDLLNNLYLTSLELDEKYATANPASWRAFLKHTSIKNYLDSYKTEIQEKMADKALTTVEKPRDALKMKEAIDKKRDVDTNKNIIVFFIPQKDYTL